MGPCCGLAPIVLVVGTTKRLPERLPGVLALCTVDMGLFGLLPIQSFCLHLLLSVRFLLLFMPRTRVTCASESFLAHVLLYLYPQRPRVEFGFF